MIITKLLRIVRGVKSKRSKGQNRRKMTERGKHKRHPYERAGLLSKTFFCWMLPVLSRGFWKQVNLSDIPRSIPINENSRHAGSSLEKHWERELNKDPNKRGPPKLFSSLVRNHAKQILLTSIISTFCDVLLKTWQAISLGNMIYYSSGWLASPSHSARDLAIDPESTITTNATDNSDGQLLLIDNTNNRGLWWLYDPLIQWTTSLVLCTLVFPILIHWYCFQMMRLGIQIRVATSYLIYKKAVKLSHLALGQSTIGQMVNLLSNDVDRFDLVVIFIPFMWIAPLQVVLTMWILWYLIGWASMALLVILIVFTAIQWYLSRMFAYYRNTIANLTDTRSRYINEVISAIRVVKTYAWERHWHDKITKARNNEMRAIKDVSFYRAINQAVGFFSSKIIVFVVIATTAITGNLDNGFMDPWHVFLIISLLNNVQTTVSRLLPQTISFWSETMVSVERIEEFLLLEERLVSKSLQYKPLAEVQPSGTIKKLPATNILNDRLVNGQSSQLAVQDNAICIKFDRVSASWTQMETTPALVELSLDVHQNELLIVCGPVASGKSSLLLSILGECPLFNGTLQVAAKLGYASQQAWIFAGTVRDNILFGESFQAKRYSQVVEVCALERDLNLFEMGDQTWISDKGTSLSGGQKARINLARCLYRDCDVYLLDDPLSAVDSHVSEHLFFKAIKGFLKNKSVILVTHHVEYLKHSDTILLMNHGKALAYGNFKDIRSHGIDFLELSQALIHDKSPIGTKSALATSTYGSIDEPSGPDDVGASHDSDIGRSRVEPEGNKPHPVLASVSAPMAAHHQPPVPAATPSTVRAWSRNYPARGSFNKSAQEIKDELRDSNRKRTEAMTEYLALPVVGVTQGPSSRSMSVTGGLNSGEQQHSGSVSLTVWLEYLTSGSKVLFMLTVAGFIISQIFYTLIDGYLSVWTNIEQQRMSNNFTDANVNPNYRALYHWVLPMTLTEHIYSYLTLIIILTLFSLVKNLAFFAAANKTAIYLHAKLLTGAIYTDMSYFDKNPIRVILNRATRDMGVVDEILPVALFTAVEILLQLFATLCLISSVDYYLLVPSFILLAVIIGFYRFFVGASRDLKRLENMARSPIFSHLASTLQGLATIRACKHEKAVEEQYIRYQNEHTGIFFYYIGARRWLAITLDILNSVYIFGLCIWCITYISDGSAIGLMISSAIVMCGLMQFGFFKLAETEAFMTSVERVMECIDLKQEENYDKDRDWGADDNRVTGFKQNNLFTYGTTGATSGIPTDTRIGPKSMQMGAACTISKSSTEPTAITNCQGKRVQLSEWPQTGKLQFNSVTLAYNPDDKPVLHNLSFVVESGERVGIVGRTGAGKTSVISALFRLYGYSGEIMIDLVDTKKLALKRLRENLSIIPQDPIIFTGSFRSNVDPFDQYTDEQIWKALEQVHLKETVNRLPDGLASHLSEGGNNLSAGQKQLVCLARTLLKNNKILVLDEATANVDHETDTLIQEAMRTQFVGCTVLTIAHRLNTIIDYDKVLVMDQGRVIEYAEPHVLLQNSEGVFAKMVAVTGQSSAAHLMDLARAAYESKQAGALTVLTVEVPGQDG